VVEGIGNSVARLESRERAAFAAKNGFLLHFTHGSTWSPRPLNVVHGSTTLHKVQQSFRQALRLDQVSSEIGGARVFAFKCKEGCVDADEESCIYRDCCGPKIGLPDTIA
jgi:hypothetical protein